MELEMKVAFLRAITSLPLSETTSNCYGSNSLQRLQYLPLSLHMPWHNLTEAKRKHFSCFHEHKILEGRKTSSG